MSAKSKTLDTSLNDGCCASFRSIDHAVLHCGAGGCQKRRTGSRGIDGQNGYIDRTAREAERRPVAS